MRFLFLVRTVVELVKNSVYYTTKYSNIIGSLENAIRRACNNDQFSELYEIAALASVMQCEIQCLSSHWLSCRNEDHEQRVQASAGVYTYSWSIVHFLDKYYGWTICESSSSQWWCLESKSFSTFGSPFTRFSNLNNPGNLSNLRGRHPMHACHKFVTSC